MATMELKSYKDGTLLHLRADKGGVIAGKTPAVYIINMPNRITNRTSERGNRRSIVAIQPAT